LDACYQLIERLSLEREQLSARLQAQETFVADQSPTVVALEDSRQQLSQENEELQITAS
jgi:hypothetical protein